MKSQSNPKSNPVEQKAPDTGIQLGEAIIDKNSHDVEILLRADPTSLEWCIEGSNEYPLHLAVRVNSPDIIKLLLTYDADPTLTNKNKETPIMLASKKRYWDCVRAFTLFKTDAEDTAGYGHALLDAVMDNDLSVAHALLKAGALHEWESVDSSSSLHIAVKNNNLQMLRLLLLYSADVARKDENKRTPKDLALELKHSDCVDLLSGKREQRSYQYFVHEKFKELDRAIAAGDLKEVESRINDKNININEPIDFVFRMSFLMAAVVHAKTEIVACLLEKNIDMSVADAVSNMTALAWSLRWYAAKCKNSNDHKNIALQLIKKGADVSHDSVRDQFSKIVDFQDELIIELENLTHESKQEDKQLQLDPVIVFNICMMLGYKYLRCHEEQKADATFSKARQVAINNNIKPGYVQQTIGFSVSFSINYDEIKLGEELGRGSFGITYRGQWKDKPVAVKWFEVLNDDELAVYKEEAAILKRTTQLGLPNVVHYYGSARRGANYYIVMEYMPKSLYMVLKSESLTLTLLARYKIIQAVVRGVAGVHGVNILHRDLKSNNTVLNNEMTGIKLCDFGCAINYSSARPNFDWVVGTYPAPEIFQNGKHTKESDIFSLGIKIWEIVVNNENREDYRRLTNHEIAAGKRPPIPSTCDLKLARLIKGCWSQKPECRLTAREALNEVNALVEDQLTQVLVNFRKGVGGTGL